MTPRDVGLEIWNLNGIIPSRRHVIGKSNVVVVVVNSSLQSPKLRCFAVSVVAVYNDSTVSVVGFEGQS